MLFIVFFIAIVFGALLIFRMDEERRVKAGALTVVVFSILLCMLLIFQLVSHGGDSFTYLGFFNMTYGAANVWIHIFIVMTLAALLTYLGASE
ncbi:hypothetical protein NSQ20_05280 [Paenibacillus sp. FSL K6-1122]|uniref:hypothetical protein n=1 Tax=Paenibacillus TaxID=44249 RepID=UPI000C27ABAC|nr:MULTISPECIES: hypothetical protein [Paenibacillus]MBY0114753.1 hypothetical protein [Paenibacillus xylanexedens]PJN64947.1 hypothetical protein PAEAM_05410 [Paenibacillus sp. GM1FR]